MSKLPPQSYKNFSGGYTRENAVFTEKIAQFVEGSKNIDIEALQDDGYGFGVMLGNTEYYSISGEKIYNLKTYDNGNDDYLIIYTDAGKVYEYDDVTDTQTELIDTLTTTANQSSFVNMSFFDIGLSITRHIGFFCNGVDSPFIYEKGASPEVQTVTNTDEDGRIILGHIAISFDGRMWMNHDNRLHRSKQLDPFDWSTPDDAGYKEFDSEITAITPFSGGLLVSTNNGFIYVSPVGDGTYTYKPLSANFAVNHKCLSLYGKNALFYAEDGLYPVDVTQTDSRQVNDSLSINIDIELSELDYENAELLEVTTSGRRETWLHFPGAEDSRIYIFRWKKGHQGYAYWLPPRIQQKINCLHIYKNKILSGTDDGKILEEMSGNPGLYDGVFYPSVATPPKKNFGNYSGKQQCQPIIFVDNLRNNNLYVKTFINGDSTNPQTQFVVANNSESLIWGEGNWGDNSWAVASLNRIELDKAKAKSNVYECSAQWSFEALEEGNDFFISAIDLTRIKKKFK